jgi:hypothetical protein
MKTRFVEYNLVGLIALSLVLYLINSFASHPAEPDASLQGTAAWKTYENPKFGFAVDLPTGWETHASRYGVEIYHPDSGTYISVRAIPEETAITNLPLDEYLIERAPLCHPYFKDTLTTVHRVTSRTQIAGYQTLPRFADHARGALVSLPALYKSRQGAVLTCFPPMFTGDSNTVAVELLEIGRPSSVYERIVHSYRFMFKMLRQTELLSQKLIGPWEIPDPSVAYVGETKGYLIDMDGDGMDELLIAGMRRTVQITEDKCFFRVLRKTDDGYRRVLENSYPQNSFLDTDIRILNLDNRPGYEVFLRFWDYGNEWGDHSTTFLFSTGSTIRFVEMGAFAEPRDIDGDGIDEVVKAVRTYFGPGAVCAWYDVYEFEDGKFSERNLSYSDYYRHIILPGYHNQLDMARNEMMLSRVQKFRVSVYYMMRRLQKYIKWSETLAQGRPVVIP